MTRKVKHRNVSTVWLYDFLQFEEFSQDRDRVLFLSMMDMNLIWNAVQNINLLQTRVYTEAEGQLYTTVDDAQFETFQGWVSDLRNHLGEYLVTNELLAQIVVQLEAIANRPCCPDGSTTGSRGSGSTSQPPNPYDQAETPTEPPPGFPSMPVFNSHKCNAAEDLLNDLGNDLIGLSGVTYAGQSPTGLIGALILILLTPIPYDDLIALAAYLIYSAYSYTFLAEMAAQIDANKDDLRCTLFNSPDSSEAQTSLLAQLEEIALATFTTTAAAEWVMGAIEYMLPYDATNKLFQDLPTVSQDADCSDCLGGLGFAVNCYKGEIVSTIVGELVLESIPGGGTDKYIAIGLSDDFTYHVELVGGTITVPDTDPDFWTFFYNGHPFECESNFSLFPFIWDYANLDDFSEGTWAIRSSTPFTLKFTTSAP